MDLPSHAVVQRNPAIIETAGAHLLLFNPVSGRLYELNETGEYIWRLLDAKRDLRAVRGQLAAEFTASERMGADLSEFVGKLLDLQFVEIVS